MKRIQLVFLLALIAGIGYAAAVVSGRPDPFDALPWPTKDHGPNPLE